MLDVTLATLDDARTSPRLTFPLDTGQEELSPALTSLMVGPAAQTGGPCTGGSLVGPARSGSLVALHWWAFSGPSPDCSFRMPGAWQLNKAATGGPADSVEQLALTTITYSQGTDSAGVWGPSHVWQCLARHVFPCLPRPCLPYRDQSSH